MYLSSVIKKEIPMAKDEETVIEVTSKQLEWLFEGLAIEQKKAHQPVKVDQQNQQIKK